MGKMNDVFTVIEDKVDLNVDTIEAYINRMVDTIVKEVTAECEIEDIGDGLIEDIRATIKGTLQCRLNERVMFELDVESELPDGQTNSLN